MGFDSSEARRRGDGGKPKLSTKHPIAAIEKRVIDSEAFRDLMPSSPTVLLLYARNLEKGRNGHTFVSQDDAARHGIERKTFYRSLIDLQAHGFIYPTTRGGHGQCARYALTWLSLSKDTRGLQVDGFESCAWRDWTPEAKKNRGGKMSPRRGQKGTQRPFLGDKKGPSLGDKKGHVEVNTTTHRDVVPILRVKKKGALHRLNGFAFETEGFNGSRGVFSSRFDYEQGEKKVGAPLISL